MADYKEFAYNYIEGEKTATICSSQRTWATKIKKLAAKHPDQVVIKTMNKDGSFVAEVPRTSFIFRLPKKMSEKNKKAAKERFVKLKKNKA